MRGVIFFIVLVILLMIVMIYLPDPPKKLLHERLTKMDRYLKNGPEIKPIALKGLDVRIVVPGGSPGTDTDAEIYHKLIPESRVIIVDYDDQASHPEASVWADINIYVEKILGIEEGLFPSRKKIMMVNQEMLLLTPALGEVDLFICKSRYCERLMRDMYPAIPAVNIGHTSAVPVKTSNVEKDYGLFVHFAGKSWLKNTLSVIQTWIDANGFPEHNNPRLVITCRDRCVTTEIANLLSSSFTETSPHKHLDYPNIEIWTEMCPDNVRNELIATAGFFLCPSEVEGYGHYINEGRAMGAVVITTDAEMMNELVDEESGFLIPASISRQEGSVPGSLAWDVDPNEIETTVRKALTTPYVKLKSMGDAARRRYEHDLDMLTREMEKIMLSTMK